MADHKPGNGADSPTKNPQLERVMRSIQKIKCYFNDRRAQKQKESTQDRASRRTANATIAIAFLTIAVVVVGGLQYLIFKAQLKVMADQLVEMKGTGTQTDQIIDNNKKLAEAAVRQAAAAENSAIAAGRVAEITSDNSVRQLRAYIGVKIKSFEIKKGGALVLVTIKNNGATPARNVFIRGQVFISEGGPPTGGRPPIQFGDVPTFEYFGGEFAASTITNSLGTGQEDVRGVDSRLPFFDKKTSFTPKARDRIYAIGAVYYLDIFGKQRFSRFCYYAVGSGEIYNCSLHNDSN